MKLHSLGTAVKCGKCGCPSHALYAETSHAAIHLGQGVCPTCYGAPAAPLQIEHTERAGRRRPGRNLVGMVEDERELMRGRLTGATVEQDTEECAECADPVEENKGNGDEGGSL